MKQKFNGWMQLMTVIMMVFLVLDIGIQAVKIMGDRTMLLLYDYAEKIVTAASDHVGAPIAFARQQKDSWYVTEYYPSKEDIEAVINENSDALIADMDAENDKAKKEDTKAVEETEEIENDIAAAMAGVPTGEVYARQSLRDYDFLLKNFYVVDDSTCATVSLFDADELLDQDLTMNLEGDEPKILIYHTHSQEEYKDSKEGDMIGTVVGVGEKLKEILENEYHVAVYHDLSVYDMEDGELDRNKAYAKAAVNVKKILEEYPSIEVVIDIHRDGVPENVNLVSTVNGKKTAKIMFLNGLCRNSVGNENGFAENPNLTQNLALSLQMQLKAKAYFPSLVRSIYLRAYRYNMHFKGRSLLVEVGAQNNTAEEAKNAMEPLAAILYSVLTNHNLPFASP